MKIDLSCPVEAWKVTLPKADDPQSTVKLFNLSSMMVVSVEVTITFSTADGEESAKVTHRGRALAGVPGKVFYMTVPVEQRIKAEVYEITIDKVWFDNSSVWRREKDAFTEFEPNNLRRSSQLTTLRAIAGDMASGYPVQQSGLWVCVCGRPNPDAEAVCVRCHREKGEVFARYSQEAIEAAVAARDSELTTMGREVLARASDDSTGKDRVRRKNKKWIGRTIRTVAALCVVAALAYGTVCHLLPRIQYEQARDLYEQADSAQDYAAADAALSAMKGYRDAEELAERSRYAQAMALLKIDENNKAIPADLSEETLLDARGLLNELLKSELPETAGLRDAIPGQITACDEAYGAFLLAERRLDEAEAIYERLGTSLHEMQMKEITYQRALDAKAEKRWGDVRAILAEIPDYKDSATLVKDAWYEEGVQALMGDEPQTGLAILTTISSHRDADVRILQYHYDQGVRLREDGKLDEAAESFYLAIGYKDAADQANECFYAPACAAYEVFDYERAAQLFGKILDYRDARDKWSDSICKAAEKLIGQIRYADAAALLSQLPPEHEQGAALLLDCTYHPAKNALVRGDYAEAVEKLLTIPGHRDSDALLQQARYALAEEKREAGDLAAAEELYVLLGDYEKSAEKLTEVRYAQAGQLLAAKDEASLTAAVAAYTALGEYQDSADKLKEANYALAGVYLDKGEHAKARAIYQTLGDYAGTAEQLKACDYVLALELAADGKTTEAIAIFNTLGDYGDSADHVNKLHYEAAAALAKKDPAGAIEAFAALGDYGDAAEQANKLRYQAAEALIATDRAGAIKAFKALGDYGDSADRANALLYADAEALLETDRAGAIKAFLALGDYSDSADRAGEMLYADAEALLASGDLTAAAEAFDAIAFYGDSAARADQIRYDLAQQYVDAGDWENARLAFEAMGGAENVDDQINQLRYEAAEELLKAGQKETAAAAFAAIGSYKDSADRAGQLRYEAAEALLETNWRAAAEAFEALQYKDSATRAKQARYDGAQALAAAGQHEEAIAIFTALGDYSNSAERVLQLRYNQAEKLAAAGAWDEAVEVFAALGDYADSSARITRTRYDQAKAVEAEGDLLTAANLFATLGNYQDAKTQAERLWDAYYGVIVSTVSTARQNEDHQHVYLMLRSEDMDLLPEKYAFLREQYHEACFKYGEKLYREGRPYEAWACYEALPAGYEGMASVLQRPCYLILGVWTDTNGNTYEFLGDGRCRMGGDAQQYFIVRDKDMEILTGTDLNALEKTHRIGSVTKKNAWLYLTTGEREVSIYLTRTEE